MKASSRVVFNTMVLYVRLIIGMVIGLFTTRLVLGALGETDFGIYALVAGVVGLLGILNSSMSNASMRFMAHSLGSGDTQRIRKTFNTTLSLHFLIGIAVVVIMEAVGILMFEHLLDIPASRIGDAKIVFHFMVVTTFVTIIAVPYDAVINAHENLLALSVIDVFGYILKLGIAIYLTYSDGNLLVLYGLFVLLTHIILRLIKQWYSRRKYSECRVSFRRFFDKSLSKEILSFSGWNLFGSIAAISVTQVRGVLLNMFFGVTVNAADGIAKQAGNQVNMVSVSMTRALNPQLVKSEGGGDRPRMLRLTELATKYSVFLFAMFAIPVIIEANYLMNLWLKNVPEYSVIFLQLLLVGLLLDKFSFEITSALRAAGRIKEFQVAETAIIVLNIPLGYLVFKQGLPPYAIFFVGFFISILVLFSRLLFAKRLVGMNIRAFFLNSLIPIIFPVGISVIAAGLAAHMIEEGFLRLATTTLISLIAMSTCFWFFGVSIQEKRKLTGLVFSILKTKQSPN